MTFSRPVILLAFASFLTAACAPESDALHVSGDQIQSVTPVHIDLWRGNDGAYYFYVAGDNGEIMLASEAYHGRAGAVGGVLSVLTNGARPERYRLATNVSGEVALTLHAVNGATIATSEGYVSVAGARHARATSAAAIAGYVPAWSRGVGARWDVFPGADGRFYFHLVAANGEIMLQSQGYDDEASALAGALAIADAHVDAYSITVAAAGGYYLDVRAGNHQVLATSEVYASHRNASRARDAIVLLVATLDVL